MPGSWQVGGTETYMTIQHLGRGSDLVDVFAYVDAHRQAFLDALFDADVNLEGHDTQAGVQYFWYNNALHTMLQRLLLTSRDHLSRGLAVPSLPAQLPRC